MNGRGPITLKILATSIILPAQGARREGDAVFRVRLGAQSTTTETKTEINKYEDGDEDKDRDNTTKETKRKL